MVVSRNQNNVLFTRNIRFMASSLEWDATWSDSEHLTVQFHDFGPNVSFYQAKTNHITKRTFPVELHLKYDQANLRFIPE